MKMRYRHKLLVAVVILASILVFGPISCGPGPSGNGYTVQTVTVEFDDFGVPFITGYSTPLNAELILAYSGATGTTAAWSGSTGGFFSNYTAASPSTVIVPGEWAHTVDSGPCAGGTFIGNYEAGVRKQLQCVLVPSFFSADPSSIDASAVPNVINVYGNSMTYVYGNPVVLLFDSAGNALAQSNASFVSGDGTWLQVPTSLVSGIYSGTYVISINNVLSDGTLD